MQNAFLLADSALNVSTALPGGAVSVVGTGIDLMNSTNGDLVANVEFDLAAPALTTTQLPDTKTITYDILTSVNADMSSPTVLMPGVIVQTGAGGVGAVAASFRFRLTNNTKRYLAAKATGVATVAATGSSMTLTPRF